MWFFHPDSSVHIVEGQKCGVGPHTSSFPLQTLNIKLLVPAATADTSTVMYDDHYCLGKGRSRLEMPVPDKRSQALSPPGRTLSIRSQRKINPPKFHLNVSVAFITARSLLSPTDALVRLWRHPSPPHPQTSHADIQTCEEGKLN